MTNYEKAIATYKALEQRKKFEVLINQEVAKLAKKKDDEATDYTITNMHKCNRRKR